MLDTLVKQNEEILCLLKEVLNAVKPKEKKARGVARKTAYPREAIIPVVESYLNLTGRSSGQVVNDPSLWGRWILSGDRLLKEFKGNKDLAIMCMEELSRKWDGVEWTMDGVAKRAMDWLSKAQAEEAKGKR